MHWRKQVTNCDLVLKINELIKKFPQKKLVTRVMAFVFIYSPSPEEYIPQLFTKYTLKRLCYAKMVKMIFLMGNCHLKRQ